jgi:lipid-A-disaccharide synthase-like uncharacterized protein
MLMMKWIILTMLEKQKEEAHNRQWKISLRWKVLQVLGAILIALGLFVDWSPPQEANLPDTASFFVILGVLIMATGFLLALRRE